jgi:excinuclease ABC subunit C
MKEASEALEFERAARLRDRLTSVRKAIEKQAVVTERPEDLDVIGISGDDLEAAVQVFYVRKGRVMGRKGFIVDKVEDVTDEQLVGHVLEGLYAETDAGDVPKEVLVPDMPDDPEVYVDWLSEARGSNVSIRVPQRGDKRALQVMVTQNAKEEFVRHRLKRASDHNARARALNSLQEALGLPDPPLRIECYDMSHIQGSDYVGSMVVMEDGLAKKSEYRRFKIRDVPGNDDFAAMEEVLTRRLTAFLAERDRPVGERPRKFAYAPNLLVVDGGKGQLGVAIDVVEKLGLGGEISVASLAKRFEEVFVPGQADPIRIPRQSDALYLLQRLRDEAHRFAITYHRQLRGKRMTVSSLDGIPGLGPTRKKRLVKELGGVAAVKAAPVDDLLALPWLPDSVARAVHDRLHAPA